MKRVDVRNLLRNRVSLPTRERELKHMSEAVIPHIAKSLPTRERELKLTDSLTYLLALGRSPRGSVN